MVTALNFFGQFFFIFIFTLNQGVLLQRKLLIFFNIIPNFLI